MVLIMNKSFGKKLTESTCLFCGAPKTPDDKCNYCGSHYLPKKQFKEIVNRLPKNVLEINPEKVFWDIDGRGQFEMLVKGEFARTITRWFDSCFDDQHKVHVSKQYTKKLLVNYKDTTFVAFNAFPTMISSSYDSKQKPKETTCTIVFDYFYILEK